MPALHYHLGKAILSIIFIWDTINISKLCRQHSESLLTQCSYQTASSPWRWLKKQNTTFGQHNLICFQIKLPLLLRRKPDRTDRSLEDVLKLSPLGSPQEIKSCTAEDPDSGDRGIECVLWCCIGRMPLLLQPKLKPSCGVKVTQKDAPLHCSLQQPPLEVRPSVQLPRMSHFSCRSHNHMS